ncbi:MAG TPA: hypothetical protein VGE97_00525 [Nitrososphaera sp.]|jgi:hypothetical protein
MTEMDPETGQGFDAVQVGEQIYFDPNATDPKYPGSVGLDMRKKTYWQGDVEFDTFETVGPKFGPKWPDGTMRVSGLGLDTDVWGLSEKTPPPPGYAPWLEQGIVDTGAGGNIFTPVSRNPPHGMELISKHDWTPCFELDGSPTMGDAAQRNFIDITLLSAYGGDIKFPVMPEEFGADFTHEYWTPRVVGLGEIIMPGGQSMETISWDSFFPASYDADYCSIKPTELEDPKSVTARIIWTMRFKMNCMLIVGGGIWSDQVVITNFNYRHKAGEIDDIYYTISMKRYRAPIVSTSPNPESIKDRWYKDPRQPGGGVDVTPPTQEGEPPADPNPAEVPVVPEPPNDQVNPGVPGRNSLITIETDVVRSMVGIPRFGGSQEFGETFALVVERLRGEGPNDMDSMLALNKWVTDNGYNPSTSNLPVGAGVRYYKETPVTRSPGTIIEPHEGGGGGGGSGGFTGGEPGEDPQSIGDALGVIGGGIGGAIGGAVRGIGDVIGLPKNTPIETPREGGGNGGGSGGFN